MNSRRADRRARLRSLTRAAYTAAAGHLEIDPEEVPDRPARRWSVSARAAVGAAAVVLVVGVALALRTWALAPQDAVPLPPPHVVEATGADADPHSGEPAGADRAGAAGSGPAGGAATSDGADAATTESPDGAAHSSSVVVHVAGAVTQPGVVELAAGARVADAVTAAGGPAVDAEVAAVNLARVLVDGEQVYVPRLGESPPGAAAGASGGGAGAGPPGDGVGTGSSSAAAAGPVNLNTATVAELDTLPGVGPVLAQRIVDWRDQDGPFLSVEDLDAVSGIGPAMMERLRDLVTT